MSDEPDEPRRRSTATWIGVTLILVFVVYSLSIGPVGVLCARTMNWTTFDVVYAPLTATCELTSTSHLVIKYRNWWFMTGTSNFTRDLDLPFRQVPVPLEPAMMLQRDYSH
jgi:hypothetical protein